MREMSVAAQSGPSKERRAPSLPLSTYSAPGGLRQDPGRAAEFRAETRTYGDRGWRMADHAVVVAGGGPTGLMLAGELALAGVDVGIVERRASQDLIGSRARGLHSRTIEVLDHRGIADRFLSQVHVSQVSVFVWIRP